jgi:hypothetical protein
LQLMPLSMPTHKDHEKDVGAEACPRPRSRRRLATGAWSSIVALRGGVRKASALTSKVVRALRVILDQFD